MSLDTHQLHRSLAAMAHDIRDRVDQNQQRKSQYSLRETECQIQIDIAGLSGGETIWKDVEVTFPERFYAADGKRDTPNDDPHYSSGYTVESGPPVMISAHVSEWITSGDDEYLGARVRIGAFDTANTGEMFTGVVHLTFQGVGAPVDDEQGDYDHQATTGG
jgi:hypothetical protein